MSAALGDRREPRGRGRGRGRASSRGTGDARRACAWAGLLREIFGIWSLVQANARNFVSARPAEQTRETFEVSAAILPTHVGRVDPPSDACPPSDGFWGG